MQNFNFIIVRKTYLNGKSDSHNKFTFLQTFKDELLTLDFENIVKYIQVTLPKKCRNHKTARKIITRACDIKLKKLDKYEREFLDMKSIYFIFWCKV